MLSFKPQGFLSSLPTAHTFFGAFCWGVLLFYGEERLRSFLDAYRTEPPLLFSSSIYRLKGQLLFPKPACMGLRWQNLSGNSIQAYRRHKRLKSVEFVSEEVLRSFLEGKGAEPSPEAVKVYEKALVPHASINRLTSTTAGGELFFERLYSLSEFCLLVQVRDWHFEEEPQRLLPAIYSLLPLGGNKSTGRGLFEVKMEKTPQWLLDHKEGEGYFYSLSDFFFDEGLELDMSYYHVDIRRPAVENYFARADLLWKGPMLFIRAGAVMKTREKKTSYGKLKGFSKTYHYGYALPLYLKGNEPC